MTNSDAPSPEKLIQAVDSVIQGRKTVKVVDDLEYPIEIPDDFSKQVHAALEIAGWAPFHYTVDESHTSGREQNSPVPWRFYPIDHYNCQQLAKKLSALSDNGIVVGETILRLIRLCGTMVLVTWLPEPDSSPRAGDEERKAFVNQEHIAAAAAATQNLLLACKARKIDSYWSSGGILRQADGFKLCGIPAQEKLLGAIFLRPELQTADPNARPGKNRDARGKPSQWIRWVNIA